MAFDRCAIKDFLLTYLLTTNYIFVVADKLNKLPSNKQMDFFY